MRESGGRLSCWWKGGGWKYCQVLRRESDESDEERLSIRRQLDAVCFRRTDKSGPDLTISDFVV